MSTHILSKTTYMRGTQCARSLYFLKNRRDLIPPVDARRQAIYDTGTRVGLLAQQLFPGGVDLSPESHYDYTESLDATRAAIARGEPILYEPAFMHDGVLAALDILVRDERGWVAYEVKSSASVKDYQVQDLALQTHVIESSGLPLADVNIVHLNNTYVRSGAIDVAQLFSVSPVGKEVRAARKEVPERIEALKQMLAAGEDPGTPIGPHCDAPFECDFKGHCWEGIDRTRSVLALVGSKQKAWELLERGFTLLTDIPDDEPLWATQRVQVNGWKLGRHQVDAPKLARWLADLCYPLHFFDFETMNPAVPAFDGTRPFQQVPFQYSLHVQRAPGSPVTHSAFLGDGTSDPRVALVEQLLREVEPTGDILAHHAAFEKGRLQDLARDVPQHAAAIARLLPRIKDLETPFKQGWYYAPAMNGSNSIKAVLPALVPDLSYEALPIREGTMAGLVYQGLAQESDAAIIDQHRRDLLAYCELDTLAMVRIVERLRAAVEDAS